MPQPALDLTALAIFSAVAQEGSVTRAAERLGRVQSNVTTRVRQLETALDTPLFLREGKRMQLTPQGQVLHGYARRLLALAEEARQAMHPHTPAGTLRLGAMESTAASRLPAPLAALHRRWPDLALELRTGATQTLLDQLHDGQLDAALVAWPPGQAADPALATRPVCTEELLLVLPADHPPVTGPHTVQPATLAAFAPGCTYRRIAQEWLAPRAQPLRVLELGSYHAILACVAAGGCMGAVPRSVLALSLPAQAPALRTHVLQPIDTWLVQRRGFHSPAIEALHDALCEVQGSADAPPGTAP